VALSQSPGLLKRFRRTPWKFQHTFVTPRQNLQPFVTTIVSALQPLRSGAVTINQVVFEATDLVALAGTDSIPQLVHDSTLSSVGPQDTEALLRAALRDSPDFVFIPTPRPFVIYADHDGFTTFFAHTKSNLNRVVIPLCRHGFKSVEGWQRRF
jgi:hypothetical protein